MSNARGTRRSALSLAAFTMGCLLLAGNARAVVTATDPDINDDGVVNILDISLLGSCYGKPNPQEPENTPCCRADTNGDNRVDLTDYRYVVGGFGRKGFPRGPGLNCPPVADAGPDQSVPANDPAPLDGSGSWDPEGKPITYRWSADRPECRLSEATAVNPTVSADGPMTCVLGLVVNAGWYDSEPDAVVVVFEEPAPPAPPDIDAPHNVDFGCVEAGGSVEVELPVRNVGGLPLTVSGASVDNPVFSVDPVPGDAYPIVLAPGESRPLSVWFRPPAGDAPQTYRGTLAIFSDDPDEPEFTVRLVGRSVFVEPRETNPITGARVVYDPAVPAYDRIDAASCDSVGGEVTFGALSSAGDAFTVVLTDGGGRTASSAAYGAPGGPGVASFAGIDACGLADGVIAVSVVLTRNGAGLAPYVGTPAGKNTSALQPPVLDPLDSVTALTVIEVCGSSREETTVRIEGGAQTVSTRLGAGVTRFCVGVPLKKNAQNTLLASAIDDQAPAPRPVAYAAPVDVFQVDPSEIVLAEAYSRLLTTAEVEALVANGVIDLDDPSNYNVSIFTVVLSIRGYRKTITFPPWPRPKDPGPPGPSVPWIPDPPGWGPPGAPDLPDIRRPCAVGCYQPIVIPPPPGREDEGGIPGIIIIDGRVKTLKEFFQVTLLVWNTSASFTLSDLGASIQVPSGLTPMAAGPGTDVGAVNNQGAVDRVEIGDVGPGETGQAQFIVRGDALGTRRVDVNYYGFLTGGGLPVPWPVAGSAATTVDVVGPPELGVVVRHPSNPAGDDVVAGQIYDLLIDITNLSSRPALYSSLELFVGGAARLVDENDEPLSDSNRILTLGHIQPGQTVQAAFRVEALASGEIIACQAIAAANITLTVDTGGAGGECLINNLYPANFEPLPAEMPPTVIGINPLNNQRNVPATASVVAVLTPQSACLYPDSWADVVTAPVDPNDPSQGDKVLAARLVDRGTFYLEELDPFGGSVRNIPTDLTLADPPAGGTTIAVLRPGQGLFAKCYLLPNTTYRATLVGEDRGDAAGNEAVCNLNGTAFLESSFQWTFSTAQPCDGVTAPTVALARPEDGSVDRPLNQPIVLQFTNRMSAGSFRFDPTDPAASTFGVYQNAAESAGDLSGGDPIPGTGRFNALLNTLTYTPSVPLAQDATIHVRLTGGVRDVCGNPLVVPAGGVRLFRFRTEPPDTTPPDRPLVDPVPALTNLLAIAVSGSAEAGSTVTIDGGAAARTVTASDAGRFLAVIPLLRDQANDLVVRATDGSGNVSAPADSDRNGDPLTLVNDVTPPTVTGLFPPSGATGVPRDAAVWVTFSEPILADSVNGRNFVLEGSEIPGTVAPEGAAGLVFTPDALLEYLHPYTVRMRAGGIKDRAGNGLAVEFVGSFVTVHPAPTITELVPAWGLQGSTMDVELRGTGLVDVLSVGVSGDGVTPVGPCVGTTAACRQTFVISADATPGPRDATLTTPGGSATGVFQVVAPPTSAVVDPLPSITRFGTVNVSGLAGSGVAVRVLGGLTPAEGFADTVGRFTVSVSLAPDAANDFTVVLRDALGNESAPTTADSSGDPLRVIQDSAPPTVRSVAPADGAGEVPLDAVVVVEFSEDLAAASVGPSSVILELDGNPVAGVAAQTGPRRLAFTPDQALQLAATYGIRVPAGAVTDLAGNLLSLEPIAKLASRPKTNSG
ncbi:MAG: Ig-like domain-containing protein [Deferrisomatales bacterium]